VQQRAPFGYGPGTVPRLIVVQDARKQSAQIEGSQDFASTIEGGADRGGFRVKYRDILVAWARHEASKQAAE
jgi:hypothetical protein